MELNLQAVAPVVIMMVGLQGSGKTTTSAKLALRLRQKLKKKVLVASLDTYLRIMSVGPIDLVIKATDTPGSWGMNESTNLDQAGGSRNVVWLPISPVAA